MTNTVEKANKVMEICPDIDRKIYVTDDWYPTYEDEGGTYIKCDVLARYYNGYYVKIIFHGGDDFTLEKETDCNTIEDVKKVYNEFVNYMNNVPQNTELKPILYEDEFKLG